MKTKLLKTAVVTVLAFGVLVGNAWAQKETNPNPPQRDQPSNEQTIQGTVNVTKDKDGNITTVTLMVTEELSYSITIDEKGKELGQKTEGKKVEVTGTVETKDGIKWLTVKTYNEVVAEPLE